ncbi:MAG: DNA polymerase III subunit gamma/tau, partial [Selenomonadaceae bacterium]|nr:DNA polymerase III subunit gamma/tau [Selenomonadaceae bacterium]
MAHEALYTRGRPKTLSHLIGQEHISNALARAISTNRLSHAYLLVGTRGTGKTSTARLLAKAMNCDRVHEAQRSGRALEKKEIPCNKCDACKNFDSSQDNVEFDAASNRSVEDVTRLLSTAHFAPLRARVKTFIIDEVHMLSFEAVNSILKLIEEPPSNVAFFLATTELNKVPMTIRSRCQVLNFRLIPQAKIAPYLVTLANRLNVTLHEDAAQKIARLAAGSMRDALTYLDQCYAVSEGEITLAQVNETLGLISDENLDDIISAVRARSRVEVAKAVTRAFSSGLAANVIAESLITRLRDIEFDMLDRNE